MLRVGLGFALVASLSFTVSATSLRPVSIQVKIGALETGFPKAHLDSVRKSIAHELENGHVTHYSEHARFNNTVEICVQAEGYALGRLSSAFSKLPVLEDGFTHNLSSIPCEMVDHSEPVAR